MSSWRLLAVFCALLVPVSANVFSAAIWDLLANFGGSPALTEGKRATTLVVSAVAFAVAIGWLFRDRHRILDHRALFSPEPVEPRPVLVTGLSALSERPPAPLPAAQLAISRTLIDRVHRDRIPMGDLAGLVPEVTEKFGAEVAPLPWLQNIRAIWSHRARIERIVVLLSAQSQHQFALFRELVEALIANTPELRQRGVTVRSVGRDVDFGDYNAIQRALAEALRQARAPREASSGAPPLSRSRRWRRAGRAPGYRESEISVDVTPGTKQFSIVAAIASFGPEGRFLYVDNLGMSRSYNISLRLGGGLIGD